MKKQKDTVEINEKEYSIRDISLYNYSEQCGILSKRGNAIQYLSSPNEEQKRLAITQNGYAIRYIDNPSYELQRIASSQQPTAVQFIKNPYPDIIESASSKDPNVLAFIRHPSYEQMKSAVSRKGGTIQYIKEPTMELIELAINQNPMSISYLTRPDRNIILFAIQKKPKSVKNIINKIPRDLVLEALKRNGNLIKYVKTPDQEMIETALCHTPEAIKLIQSPTELQKEIAVSKRPKLISSFSYASDGVQLAAVKACPDVITVIKEVSNVLLKTYDKEKIKRNKEAKKEYFKQGITPSQHIKTQMKYRQLIEESLESNSECFFLNQFDEPLSDIIAVISDSIHPVSISIATGFLYKSGLSLLNTTISPLIKEKKKISLIVGSLQNYNKCLQDKSTIDGIDYDTGNYLKGLLSLGVISLSTYENQFFHGKYYLLEGREYTAVVIGSSNVSASGLRYNSELNTITIYENSNQRLQEYILWYDNLLSHCYRLPSLSLECFEKRIIEKDCTDPHDVYGVKTSVEALQRRIHELSDEEVKHRMSVWLKYSPTRIIEEITFSPFKNYVLFEFAERHLFVFESFSPNNAFYCFKSSDLKA